MGVARVATHTKNVKFWSNGVAQKETPPITVALNA